jgi:hypothetical protein
MRAKAVDVCAIPAPTSGDLGEAPLGPVLFLQKFETSRIDRRCFGGVGWVSHLDWLCFPGFSYGYFNTPQCR